jgi:parafibromin
VWQFRPYKWSEPRVLFHHGECLYGCAWISDEIELMMVVESERHLRVMGERPTKSKSQRLERYRTQGELNVKFSTLSPFSLLAPIQIDPHRRHVDKSTVAYFWKTLDTWTAMHKPSLMTT